MASWCAPLMEGLPGASWEAVAPEALLSPPPAPSRPHALASRLWGQRPLLVAAGIGDVYVLQRLIEGRADMRQAWPRDTPALLGEAGGGPDPLELPGPCCKAGREVRRPGLFRELSRLHTHCVLPAWRDQVCGPVSCVCVLAPSFRPLLSALAFGSAKVGGFRPMVRFRPTLGGVRPNLGDSVSAHISLREA